MGNAGSERLEIRERGGELQRETVESFARQTVERGSNFGVWTEFDLVACTDGKARRIEPGTFPLAHGVPARVGRLRGYGNAINPWLAAEFIAASEEAASRDVGVAP